MTGKTEKFQKHDGTKKKESTRKKKIEKSPKGKKEINKRFRFLYNELSDAMINVTLHDLENIHFDEEQIKFLLLKAKPDEILSADQIILLALAKLDARDPEYIDELYAAYNDFSNLPFDDREVSVYFNLHNFANLFTIFMGIFRIQRNIKKHNKI